MRVCDILTVYDEKDLCHPERGVYDEWPHVGYFVFGHLQKLKLGCSLIPYCDGVEVEAGQDDVEGHEHSNSKKEKGKVHSFGLISGWFFLTLIS